MTFSDKIFCKILVNVTFAKYQMPLSNTVINGLILCSDIETSGTDPGLRKCGVGREGGGGGGGGAI